MADLKISELPEATTPLNGDEAVAIVQGGVTKQVPAGSVAAAGPNVPIDWQGTYVGATAYAIGDGVDYQGSSFVAIAATTGNLPTDTDFWQVVAEKGDTGSTGAAGVSGTSALTRVRVVDTTGLDPDTEYEAGDTVDGVTLATNDLVLRAAPTGESPDISIENGVYVVPASGAASRHSDFDAYDDLPGTYFSVMEGTAKADTLWRCTSDRGGTLGTTALAIEEASFGGGDSLGYLYPEDFGTITYGRDVTEAEAIANRDAIQSAIDSLSSAGGAIFFRPGKVYEVHRTGTDDWALHCPYDNIYFIGGPGSCLRRQYDPDDPFSLIYVGDDPPANGKTQVDGGGFLGLEIDGGCEVQLVTNGQNFADTTGWSIVPSLGTVEVVGGSTSRRALRVTPTTAGAVAAYQILDTEVGVTYRVMCQAIAGTSATWNVIASTNGGTSGLIAQENSSTNPDGLVDFTFTATTTTTHILLRTSDATIGEYTDFRDIRVFQDFDNDAMPLIYGAGLRDYTFANLHIHDSKHYGIGLQNGGVTNVRIDNLLIEDTYMDGIDHKNNGTVSQGNTLSNVTLKRCGLKNNATDPSACLDLSEGWTVTDVHVLEFGTTHAGVTGIRCKQGDASDSRGAGGRYNHLSNLNVIPDLQALSDSVCIHLQNLRNTVTSFSTQGGGYGVIAEQKENSISAGYVQDAATVGIHAKDSAYATNGDRTIVSAVHVKGCTTGVKLDTDRNQLLGCVIIENTTGLNLVGGDNRITGGEVDANTTDLSNTGTGNVFRGVLGQTDT